MPELPEVETVVRDLQKKVVGRKITDVWFDWPKLIKDPFDQSRIKVAHKHVAGFKDFLRGEKIISVRRRAKNILIYLSHDKMLLVHQKMTGHFLIGKWEITKNKVKPIEPRAVVEDSYNGFIHLIFYLDNGQMLALSDVRKFAKVLSGSRQVIENLTELKNLGPDALDPKLSLAEFKNIIAKEGRTIKQALMEPNLIAGIGNIYSDDILYTAKVHPRQAPGKLTDSELSGIYRAMRTVLTKAVRLRGTSTSDFRDTAGLEGGYTGHRLVYQREGEPCQRCATAIKRITVGGRSASFCPKCQKEIRVYHGQSKKEKR